MSLPPPSHVPLQAEKAIKEFNRALVNEREITVRLYTTSGPSA